MFCVDVPRVLIIAIIFWKNIFNQFLSLFLFFFNLTNPWKGTSNDDHFHLERACVHDSLTRRRDERFSRRVGETQRIYRAAAVGRNGKIFFWQNFERGRGAKGVMEQLFKRASTHPRSGKGMRALFLLLSPPIEFFSFFFFFFLHEIFESFVKMDRLQKFEVKVERV